MEASDTTPQAPDTPVVTPEQLDQLLEAQAAQRKELLDLRQELAKAQAAIPEPAVAPSPQALRQRRLDELASVPYYCPGCGRTSTYMRECTGKPESPHAPIEVVSTDELKDPPPESDKVAYQLWLEGHTPAPSAA